MIKKKKKFVNTLANGLTTVCVDNPWLLPYIQKQQKEKIKWQS